MNDRDHFSRDTARDAMLITYGAQVFAQEQARQRAREAARQARAEYEASRPGPRPEPLTYGPPPNEPRRWTPLGALLRCFLGTLALSPIFAVIWAIIQSATNPVDAPYAWGPFFLCWGLALSWFWVRSGARSERKRSEYATAREQWQKESAAYADRIKRQMEMPLPRSTVWRRTVFFLYNRDRDSWLRDTQSGTAITFEDELEARQYWANVVNWHGLPPEGLWELCWHEQGETVSHSRGPLNGTIIHEPSLQPNDTLRPERLAITDREDNRGARREPGGLLPASIRRLAYTVLDRAGEVLIHPDTGEPLRFGTKDALWEGWTRLRSQHPEYAGYCYASAIDADGLAIGNPTVLY